MQKKFNLEACETDTFDIEYLICHVGLLWRRLLNAKIKSLGISGTEKRVLFCIARNPGLTQVQIATLLDIEPQNLMRSLDKIDKQGWLQKQADPNDRRIKCLFITPNAKKVINKIQSISDQVKPNVLANVGTKETQLVVNYLAKLRENVLQQLDAIEKV